MIRPILYLTPLFAGISLSIAQAEIIRVAPGSNVPSEPSDHEIIQALIKPAVPNPILVDTTKEDATITASDFRHFAPLYDSLTSSPKTASELEFFIRHRGRMIGAVDRRVDTGKMVQEFKKRFPTISSAPAALRTGVAAAWTRAISAHKATEPFAVALFAEPEADCSSVVRALFLAEKLRYLNLARAESQGKGRMDTLTDTHDRLVALLNNFTVEELQPISDETLMAIISPLINSAEMSSLKNPAHTLVEEAVIEKFESIPFAARRAPHEALVAKYYESQAWFRRGGAWAAETDPRRLLDFETLLEKSADHYRAALEKNPKFLPAAQGLLRISGVSPIAAGGDETHWYSLCESIDPLNEYTARDFIAASRPRWCKPPELLLNFVQNTVRESRYDTAIPALAVEALETLIDDFDIESLKDMHGDIALTVYNRYIEDQFARNPCVVSATGNPLMAYQKVHAATHLAKTKKGTANISKLHRESADPNREKIVDHLIAKNVINGAKNVYVNAPGRMLEREMNLPLADDEQINRFNDKARMTAWLKKATEESKRYTDLNNASCYRRFLPRLQEAVDFIEGKPVVLGVDGDDSYATSMDWTHADGYAEAKDLGAPTSLYGTLHGWFKPPYEVTLRIRDIALQPRSWTGIHIGRTYSDKTGRSFVINKESGDWRILRGHAKNPDEDKLARGSGRPAAKATTITVRVFPRGYTLLIDGKQVDSRRDDAFRPGVISLGTPPLMPTRGSVILENPVVRALKAEELSPVESKYMTPSKPAGS